MPIPNLSTNLPALGIISQINRTYSDLGLNIERLGTGLRINNAGDDPTGLVVRNQLRTRFNALDRASANAQDAYNLAFTADQALEEFGNILQTIRSRSQEAASSTTSTSTRLSIQSEINDYLDELNRIAETTSFNGKKLLNGDVGANAQFIDDLQDRLGASVGFGPDSLNLLDGRSMLNVAQTQTGSERIVAGSSVGFNIGTETQTDIATSVAQFIDDGGGPALAAGGDALSGLSFNKVSLAVGSTLEVSGVLADGQTTFTGIITIAALQTVDGGAGSLVDELQTIIDAEETRLGIEGTNVLETTADYEATTGRLTFYSDQADQISEFDVTITLKNGAGTQQTSSGITRSSSIGGEVVAGGSTAQIGNSLTAITGSTFDTGDFSITVASVTSAAQRDIETNYDFTRTGTGTPASLGTRLNQAEFNSVTLATADTLEVYITNPDGSTFSETLVVQVAVDNDPGDLVVRDFEDLIQALNNREETDAFVGFNGATATLTATGAVQVIDDVATSSSQTSLTFIVNATSTVSDSGKVNTTGNAEQASVSLAGGDSQTVTAGEVVTLYGAETADGKTPQITIRAGTGLSEGSDTLQITADEYEGRLNGGTTVTFANGDQDVRFYSGERSSNGGTTREYIDLDFDTAVLVTTSASAGGETFHLSSVSRDLSFYVGALSDDDIQVWMGDLRTSNLGLSSTQTLDSLDITTQTGAAAALDIIDAAIAQSDSARARSGSISSRLVSTMASLDTESLSVQQAEASISNADIAKETLQLAMNTVLLNTQASVLAQTTNLPNQIYGTLYGFN